MNHGATAVDADATLTYHRFPMAPPKPCSWCRLARGGRVAALALLAAAAATSACATSEEATKPITYSLTAKQNYEKGIAELKDENYPEAQKYFQFVKQKYPFSKFAVLAELAIADSHFERGNYTEAIDAYKAFARLHPTHEKVEDGYTAFRVGESYFKDMPDDIWLLPPSYEKDQSAVSDALRELGEFQKKFPDSKYTKKAEELRRQVQQRLVDHEVYVARFYLKGDHPKAAALRLETALRRYPGSGRDPELLFALGETYLQMAREHVGDATAARGDAHRARETFARVVAEYPTAPDARRAALYLDFIAKRYGEDVPQPLGPASAPPADAHG
jgi:outer membrane protein assembly factor BamD